MTVETKKPDDKISREIELASQALKRDEESARKNKERIKKLQQEQRQQWEAYVGEKLADVFYEKEAKNKVQFVASLIKVKTEEGI